MVAVSSVAMPKCGLYRTTRPLPGVPEQLTVTATGLVNTPAADIEIVLPEVASAEASSWTDPRPIEGRRIPAAASRRVSLGAGGSTVVQQTVTFPVAGYYTVVASARARDNDSIPDVVDGELLQDETHRVLYLLVDEQGGRPMTAMDPRALPATSATRAPVKRNATRSGMSAASGMFFQYLRGISLSSVSGMTLSSSRGGL